MSNWNRSINQSTYDSVKLFIDEAAKAYREPTWRWAPAYEEWRDDAACNGMPTDLFMLNEEDSKDDQHELIARGLRICTACPVRQACKVNSSEEDRFWSIRGGQPPEGLFLNLKKLKATTTSSSNTCQRGHNNWKLQTSGKRYCATCKEMSNKRRCRKP